MRSILIMASPVEDKPPLGTCNKPPIIGTASELCMELWGTVQSGYPRYISQALSVARTGGIYRGYRLELVNHKPIVLPTLQCKRSHASKKVVMYPKPTTIATVEAINGG